MSFIPTISKNSIKIKYFVLTNQVSHVKIALLIWEESMPKYCKKLYTGINEDFHQRLISIWVWEIENCNTLVSGYYRTVLYEWILGFWHQRTCYFHWQRHSDPKMVVKMAVKETISLFLEGVTRSTLWQFHLEQKVSHSFISLNIFSYVSS